MSTVVMEQKKRIHPHKFTLWVGLASIIMMFAGFTSAYIIKRNQANWVTFDLPGVFWYSTAVIIISSVTLWLAQKAFKNREMIQYRKLLVGTLVLGVLFIVLQIIGFRQLYVNGMTLKTNVSFSFLYVIVGLHAVHVLGGIIALMIMFAKAFNKKVRNYDMVPVEVMSTYWHFVDFLWIYLLVFLILIK
ncbi:cytochrome c oxidase subunit 3 [Ferruginibacter paludis]|uniref:cytochrome c oxidase subunit 3 n=1 Tax=Ferruginibacter TaxID=1004303 RepID=UPI0025B51E46|nr:MULTISPECIES: cytochrome c oxidase subunit 3 [Ferruginibacter]MDB5276866.1 heme-copper oxidase subunit [Ferruginibacter sp.]MDN3659354.1 cytochrome c oxidase subunit 3 [Ferruginibacter paludis]